MLIGINGGYFPAICRVCFLNCPSHLFALERITQPLLVFTGFRSAVRFLIASQKKFIAIIIVPLAFLMQFFV